MSLLCFICLEIELSQCWQLFKYLRQRPASSVVTEINIKNFQCDMTQLIGFPGGSQWSLLVVKALPANAGDLKRCKFNPWVRKILWRRAWQPTPIFLPGESHGQRSLVGFSPWGHKKSDMTEATQKAHTTQFMHLFLHCFSQLTNFLFVFPGKKLFSGLESLLKSSRNAHRS